MLKILFTSGGSAGMEALWRLYDGVYEVHFADAILDAINPVVPAKNRHKIPFAGEAKFLKTVISLCDKLDIDVLIPGVDEELSCIASSKELFLPTKIMLPSYSFIEKMLGKLSMIKVLSSYHIPVPNTYSLQQKYNDIDFPCIIKPRKGRGSRGVLVVESKSDVDSLKSLYSNSLDNYIIQNKPEGQEYTVQMIANNKGSLFAIVPVMVQYKRGITISATVVDEPNVIQGCRMIHDVNPAKGCYNIQLILTPDGVVMPFEINPRISTTFCLSVAAGIDPIAIFLKDVSANKLESFNTNIKLYRHWSNYFY